MTLTPERAIEMQCLLGADIQMVLDECTPFRRPTTRQHVDAALAPLGGALEAAFASLAKPGQACSASCRAAIYPDLRKRSAEALIEIGFDGYAIGGLAVGEGQAAMLEILDETVPLLPEDRPHYLMGVGTPDDMLQAVARGIDMFDCVMPTRSGRHCQAFTWGGKLNLRNARYAEDSVAARCGKRVSRRAI